MIINSDFLIQNTSVELSGSTTLKFNNLGLVDCDIPNTLTFIDEMKYLDKLIANQNITGVLIHKSQSINITREDIVILVSEDPRYDFYNLMNKIAESKYTRTPSIISPSANIHPRAFISEVNVKIGNNVVVEPNATILADVEIGNDSIIRSGAVIGSEGFEHKRTSKGILSVFHDGKVIIGKNVEVGANACIDKGFSSRYTIVGDYTKIDNLVHIAHGVQTGKRCFIIASSMVAGSVTLKDDVWVGPNANIAPQVTVENNGFISLGSVVTRNVSEHQHVTGNFALPHAQFLEILKKSLNK